MTHELVPSIWERLLLLFGARVYVVAHGRGGYAATVSFRPPPEPVAGSYGVPKPELYLCAVHFCKNIAVPGDACCDAHHDCWPTGFRKRCKEPKCGAPSEAETGYCDGHNPPHLWRQTK